MASTTEAIKKPPPEKQGAVATRRNVILSFWVLILLLGVPMWWKTTSIYRAELPFERMLQVPQPSLPLEVQVSSSSLSCSDARRVVHETQQVLDDLNEFSIIHLRLQHVVTSEAAGELQKGNQGGCMPHIIPAGNPEPALRLDIQPREGAFSLELREPALPAVVYCSPGQLSSLPKSLGEALRNLFADEQISVAQQYTLHAQNNVHAHNFIKSAPAHFVQDVIKRDARAFKHSSSYHITFSLFTAGATPNDWDIQAVLNEHIQPLTLALSSISDIHVASQVQLYSSFSSSVPLYGYEGLNGTILRQQDLSAFVNAAEWPLSPSIGSGPTINFIVYVPARDQIPISIEDNPGNSWLIPQWGAITILNPPLDVNPETGIRSVPRKLKADMLRQPFETFASQILQLVGVPSPSSNAPLAMRLASQQRLTALSLYLRASSSLASLARLAQHLSKIPIPKHVAQLVDQSITHLGGSRVQFQQGKWRQALQDADQAYTKAEKAFFDKAMVGQVYFPDEHKVAVYLPLLGPIGVPLVVGLLREIKRTIRKS